MFGNDVLHLYKFKSNKKRYLSNKTPNKLDLSKHNQHSIQNYKKPIILL